MKHADHIPKGIVRPLGTVDPSMWTDLAFDAPQRFATASMFLRGIDVDILLAEPKGCSEGKSTPHKADSPLSKPPDLTSFTSEGCPLDCYHLRLEHC